VTGADENYFVLACLLMQSLKRFAAEFPFYVLERTERRAAAVPRRPRRADADAKTELRAAGLFAA
jgi:hypothetical protein